MNYVTESRYIILTYLYAFWSRRYLILVILLCSPILGFILSLSAPNKYEAGSSLATFNLNQNLIKEMSSMPALEDQFAGLKAYITSPAILKKIAIQIGILSTNDSNNKIQEVIILLSKSLSVNLKEKNLVEIKLIGNNPKEMAAIVNNLSLIFMKEYLKPISSSAQSLATVLEKECQEQKSKLDDSIKQYNLFKAQLKYDPKYAEIYTEQLRNLNVSIGEIQSNYRAAIIEVTGLEQSFALDSPDITILDKEIKNNDLNLNHMKLIYNNNYVGIQAAEELSNSLRKQREELFNKYLANKNQTLSPNDFLNPKKLNLLTQNNRMNYINLQQKITNLKKQIDELNLQKNSMLLSLKKINANQNKEATLTKAIENNRKAYNDLLDQYNLAKILAQSDYKNQFSAIKIVALPMEPLPYIGHSLLFYLTITLFSGLFLSLSLAILFDIMNNTARKRETLETISGIAVISRIGKLS